MTKGLGKIKKKYIFLGLLAVIVLVGVVNTLFGTAIMFVFYNVFHLSYWLSSASNYVFGSILSYFLNKYFTFQSKGSSGKTIGRFVINITICYLCAYGLAKPLVRWELDRVYALPYTRRWMAQKLQPPKQPRFWMMENCTSRMAGTPPMAS